MSDLLGGQEAKVPKYLRLIGGKNAKQKRELEQHLLKPEKIKQYVGNKPSAYAKEPLLRSTVKFVFTKDDEMALVQKLLPVSHHVEMSVSNHGLLIALLKEVDEGNITYDKKTKSVTIQRTGASSSKRKHNSSGSTGNKRTFLEWCMHK
jgi:hypothetical protein